MSSNNNNGPKTPSQIAMDCLDRFGEDEPVNIAIVWTTQSGLIHWDSNTESLSILVGLLETAKHGVLQKLRP